MFSITKAAAASISDIGGGIGGLSQMWVDIAAFMAHPGQNGVIVGSGIVVNVVMTMIGSAAVLVILYASIRLITSAGNDETVRKAWKEMIFYAVLGLILAIISETIINYVIALVSTIASS